jgi:hypothetical protein
MSDDARPGAIFLVCLALLLVCSCSTRPLSLNPSAQGSLLDQARAITKERGLVEAREFVIEQLGNLDSSRGEMESRISLTTSSSALSFPDSLMAMGAEGRANVALVIVPGTKVKPCIPSKARETLVEAMRKAQELGFKACIIDTPYHSTPSESAEIIAGQLTPIISESEHVMLMMLSKGAHDVAFFLQDHAANWPPDERAKFKAVISLAGTVQGSIAAAWMAGSPHPAPLLLRNSLRISGQGHIVEMLEEVGVSPWHTATLQRLSHTFPNLTWISFAMIPDGEDGRVTEKVWMPQMRRLIEREAPFFSPEDGLVESLASVMPQESDLPQWVIRGFGSHILTNGRFPDGSRIAPTTTVEGVEEINPASGAELMDALLRALPAPLLDGPLKGTSQLD